MKKENFYNILRHRTPEEINKFISLHGKQKMVNAVTFTKPEKEDNKDGTDASTKNEASE